MNSCCRIAPLLALLASFTVPGQSQTTGSTVVTLGPAVATGVQRFGINLSGQSYYDSGQMLMNLVSRNPGFEGEIWQSIVQCKSVGAGTCTTADQYSVWPANFLTNATYEIISGNARGGTGAIASNTAIGAAGQNTGPTLSLSSGSPQPSAGDFLLLHMTVPGHAEAGWWINARGGTISTEFQDLPENTSGKQALRVEAAGPGQSVNVSSYFDSLATHSFVQLHGSYRLSFRAKQINGTQPLSVSFQRLDTAHGNHVFLSKTVPVSGSWHTYSYDFATNETSSALGTMDLTFAVSGSSILLDDVFLGEATPAASNTTAFRDEVVQALRDLRPGVLRYMDNGTNYGSSIDNMLTPAFGRQRAGSSTQQAVQEDIPIGLPEFLELCATVGADPWYSMPPGISPSEMQSLVEYLGGSRSTPYGARRAALGQQAPWTSVFRTIHLELGNEQWNYGTFPGASINDPIAYGSRANLIFTAARSSAAYKTGKFDLVLGSWNAVPWWTQQELKASTAHDSVAVAPYLFDNFNDASSIEAVFGPMFAQPESIDSRPTGLIMQQAAAVRSGTRPAKLAVYETNLGTMTGSVSQSVLDGAIPSLGAGLASVDHMLLAMRDAGVTVQCLFALPEFANSFNTPSGNHEEAALWGSVVDMGGATNGRRPSFLAEELANQVILPTMLQITLTGSNPTWNQPPSRNDKIQLAGAHFIQSFAFANGRQRSLILLNLSRTDNLPVTFAGAGAPSGTVARKLLTGRNITDNNEKEASISIKSSSFAPFRPAVPLSLPPFSMTTLTWEATAADPAP